MYNYVLTRVSCAAVFRLAFTAGTCIGGAGGLALGLLEPHGVGLMGGAFLGLMAGLAFGLTALACAVIFNVLAPFGGVSVRLEPAPEEERPGQEPAA